MLLTASMAMAQFGNLDDLVNGNGNNNGTTSGESNGNGKGNGGGFSFGSSRSTLIEKAIVDGFFLIKQDFQLEDTTNGNRYNWEGGKEFGSSTSFMVKLTDGYITTNDILAPWDYDENYSQFKGQKYKPVLMRTSTMTVGKEWKLQSDPIQFNEGGKLANDLRYVKVKVAESEKDAEDEDDEDDEEEEEGQAEKVQVAEGFMRATGYGKKEVWVVWLMASETEGETTSIEHCSFRLSQKEMTFEKSKNLYEVENPGAALKVIGGIVIEPIYRGIGHIDLALVGVIGQYEDKYQMALFTTETEINSDGSTLTEDSDKTSDKDRKSKKDKKSSKNKRRRR